MICTFQQHFAPGSISRVYVVSKYYVLQHVSAYFLFLIFFIGSDCVLIDGVCRCCCFRSLSRRPCSILGVCGYIVEYYVSLSRSAIRSISGVTPLSAPKLLFAFDVAR